ncbi:hypothetical protein HQQ80_13185 [Microbacteriaceae bacterium VKM Ac-2855]|nr:hypothetical protein [Microbacteriaceae bacterium VKM Ac-2855]
MSGNTILLDRDDLLRALTKLVALLKEREVSAGIRIVGGAALALKYFERRTTVDIDAGLEPAAEISAAATRVAQEEGWGDDWLNDSAVQFIPAWGEGPGWQTLYSEAGIVIEVASSRALLAMKMQAGRPGRDVEDIRQLLALCAVASMEEADDLYDAMYPGEVVPDRTERILRAIFADGVPPKPVAPPEPHFDSH